MAKDYNITKHAARCRGCDRELLGDEEIVARVTESGEDFAREDFCLPCWDKQDKSAGPSVFGVWHTKVPVPTQKKKLFIDDELLANFFQRLADSTEPAKVNFRYVLALVLMRKRMLVYDRSEKCPDGSEVWTMHFRGNDQPHKVINPRMTEQQITEVSGNLQEILQGEL